MAEGFLKPPSHFDFKHKAKWSDWIDRFEFYRKASGLSEKDDSVQVATLVYTMGPEAGPILRQFSLSAKQEKSYPIVQGKFDEYFIARRNVIFEICRFRTRHQQDSESAEAFITSLHTLSEHCGFGERRENEILYQLIIGIRDAKLSKRLQLDDKITLEKASIQVRQEEQVNSQQPVVRGSQPTPNSQPTLEEARAKRYDSKKPKATSHGVQQRLSYQRQQKDQKNPAVKCRRCGQQPGHSRAECPAAQVKCEKCHKVGHYKRLCQTKSLGDLTTEDAPSCVSGRTRRPIVHGAVDDRDQRERHAHKIQDRHGS